MIQIKGYDNYYITLNGMVWSCNRNKYLELQKHYLGYLQVGLLRDGKRKIFKVHRLVAIHFLKNIHGYKYINHIDGNKSNNVYSNLEWCTHSQNIKHAYDTGLLSASKGENHSNSKLTDSEVKEIRFLEFFIPRNDIADAYNISNTQVSNIQKNLQWKHIK